MSDRYKHSAPASAASRHSKVAALTALVLSMPMTGLLTGTAYADDAVAPPGATVSAAAPDGQGDAASATAPNGQGDAASAGNNDATGDAASASAPNGQGSAAAAGDNDATGDAASAAKDENKDENAGDGNNGDGGQDDTEDNAGGGQDNAGGGQDNAGGGQDNSGNGGNGGNGQDNTPPATENDGNKNDRVTICHATGSATNPFVVITPDKNGVLSGHVGHQDADDIIPSFDYNDHGTMKTFPGQNATPENLALLAAGKCEAPAAPPVLVVPPPVEVIVPQPVEVIVPQPVVITPQAPPVNGGGSGSVTFTPEAPVVAPAAPVVAPPTTVRGTTAGNGAVAPVSGVGGGAAASPTALPFTGANTGLLSELGLVLLITGAGATIVGRRRSGLATA